MHNTNQKLFISALLIVLAATLFWTGLNGSLRDWDESVYAQVAKESLDHSDWYNLYWNQRPFIDKPPLMFWLTRQVYMMAGVGEWQARFVSATCGLLTVILVFLFGWRFISFHGGLLAALILLGTPHFVRMAKMGQLDVPIGFFITVSMMAFYLGKKNPRWFLLSGVASGLAILTKWSVGFFAPIAQIILLVFPGYREIAKRWLWWLSFLVLGVVCAPWVIQQYMQYGDLFADHFLGSKIVQSVNAEIAGHGGGVFYYVTKMMHESRPWCFLFPLAVLFGILQAWKRNQLVAFLLVWFGVIFLIFSCAKTKLHWYIQPVYPPLALLTAMGVVRYLQSKKARIVVLAVAVSIIPGHMFFSRNYLRLDLNPDIKLLVEAMQDNMVNYDTLYVFRMTCMPSLLFYTDIPVTLLHEQDDFMQLFEEKSSALILTDPQNSSSIRSYVNQDGTLILDNAYDVEKYSIFYIHKRGG